MKDVEKVTAYRTKDGQLFANAKMAAIHAERLETMFMTKRDTLKLMIRDQFYFKRAMKYLRGKEASEMQSEIAKRAARIAKGMDFIKRGLAARSFTHY